MESSLIEKDPSLSFLQDGKEPDSDDAGAVDELAREIQADTDEEAKMLAAASESKGQSLPGNKKEDSSPGEEQPSRHQLRLMPVSEVLANTGPPDYLIDGVLEKGDLSALFGDPGTYKSFVALDMALSVASGRWWNGKETKQGPVVSFIGEGSRGYGRRILAWSRGHGRYISDAPFFVSSHPAQILDESFVKEAVQVIEDLESQHGRIALVIFDTVARSFGPGDENSTADMSAFVAEIDKLIHRDTVKLLVHHSGHGEKGRARGSSALRGAVDVEYHLTKNGDNVTMACTKSKDSEQAHPMTFEPEIVEIGTPDNPATSLYLKPVKNPIQEKVKLSPQMRQADNLLQLITRKSGISCISEWMNICREEEVYTKSAFYNAIKTMEEKKVITITGDYVERS